MLHRAPLDREPQQTVVYWSVGENVVTPGVQVYRSLAVAPLPSAVSQDTLRNEAAVSDGTGGSRPPGGALPTVWAEVPFQWVPGPAEVTGMHYRSRPALSTCSGPGTSVNLPKT